MRGRTSRVDGTSARTPLMISDCLLSPAQTYLQRLWSVRATCIAMGTFFAQKAQAPAVYAQLGDSRPRFVAGHGS